MSKVGQIGLVEGFDVWRDLTTHLQTTRDMRRHIGRTITYPFVIPIRILRENTIEALDIQFLEARRQKWYYLVGLGVAQDDDTGLERLDLG